jgi:hypothetical protein
MAPTPSTWVSMTAPGPPSASAAPTVKIFVFEARIRLVPERQPKSTWPVSASAT